MSDKSLEPNRLPPKERAEFIQSCCDGILEEIDELIALDRDAIDAPLLVVIRQKVERMKKAVDACKTDEDFDNSEEELTGLLCGITQDLITGKAIADSS